MSYDFGKHCPVTLKNHPVKLPDKSLVRTLVTMIHARLMIASLFTAGLVLGLTACKSDPPAPDVMPIEVGGDRAAAEPAPIETSPMPAESSEIPTATPAPQPAADRYAVDGMIGQVNGRALYARDILKPIHEQLTQLALQNPGMAFRRPAVEAISLRVREVVQNDLILGEAERDLNEQEQQGLALMVAQHREELLRYHGQGSVALAEAQIFQQQGRTLDQAIEDYRQQVVVRRYLNDKLVPHINVTRRDVERFYHDHRDEFHPPAQRRVRLIRTSDPLDAQALATALADHGDFIELASSEINHFKQSSGGLMEVVGDNALAMTEINDQIAQLTVGEHAGPIEIDAMYWFVFLESFEQPESKTFKQTQLLIEKRLREQQFRILRDQFMKKVLEQGSYTSLESMIMHLYDIVEARYSITAS